LLKSPADYGLITRRLLSRLEDQNIHYAEVTISAGVILWKGYDFDAIFSAIRAEAAQSAVKVNWVLDAVRQFGVDHAMQVAEVAVSNVGKGVIGFGIGGDEERGPAKLFKKVFEYTRLHGLGSVPHAGETVGAESVWEALDLGAHRIGHGITAIKDTSLMRHLRDNNVPLEVCITSNVCTGAVASLRDHPVRKLYDFGVPLILNTDDPAMFHTTLSREYQIAAEHFGFSRSELSALAAKSFEYSLERLLAT
jgi:adenosine deaminase/aminodeoxyfutalosine deaminase